MILILGAGLSGLSASYHIGHEKCVLLECKQRPFGHIGSDRRDGFTWDQGPHVSFTKHEYVKQLFEQSVRGQFEEIEVKVGNYYHSHWIDHPAQTSLHQVPEPLRSECLKSFLDTRSQAEGASVTNYQQWLDAAFGPVFANTFPSVYTKKYWTLPASALTTDWVGGRIFYPEVADVKMGAVHALNRPMHYITSVRYPKSGGYQSFAEGLLAGSNIHYGAEVVYIDLRRRRVWLANGQRFDYDQLVNTLPLPEFVNACVGAPAAVVNAARQLLCTQLLLVNVAAPHAALRPEHWMYVYDEDKLTSRITSTEKLSSNNAPKGWTGVQAEVYFSRYRPLPMALEQVGAQVERELIKLGLVDPSRYSAGATSHRHLKHVPWANVVFDKGTVPALEAIWQWMEAFGLSREFDDLHPLTDWSLAPQKLTSDASLFMAGRFGQWKYFWTDDCVLRGKRIAAARLGKP